MQKGHLAKARCERKASSPQGVPANGGLSEQAQRNRSGLGVWTRCQRVRPTRPDRYRGRIGTPTDTQEPPHAWLRSAGAP